MLTHTCTSNQHTFKLRDTEKANIYQVTCISFVFYFYTGVLALPSVDILKVSYGEEDLLFYTSTLFMLSVSIARVLLNSFLILNCI